MKCFKICYILGICVVLSFFIIYCFNFSVMSYFIPTRTRRGHSLYIREKIPNVARNEKRKKKTIWVFFFQNKANFYGQTHQVHLDSTFQSPCLPGLEIPGLDPSLQHTVHPPSKFFFWNLLLSISCMIRVVAKEIFLFVVTSFHIMQMACKTKQ